MGRILHSFMAKKKSSPLTVGIIGCGNISGAYFEHLRPFANYVKIVSCADLNLPLAQAKAAEHGLAKGYSVEELLADPEVDIVLNLTIPAAHTEINQRAIRAGKHAYCEKPFSLSYKEGAKVLREAAARGLRLGCAPDTVLGGGIQTCRQLIDAGKIGKPIAATANMLCPGHESWHPSPEFYYQPGAGPLFDMGPYYLTSLVSMLGPVKSVTARAATTYKRRLITSQPLAGKKITVNTPTHIAGVLDFVSGAVATVTMSFDIHSHHMPLLEIYGTEGSLQCPDPNAFDGDVMLWTTKDKEWQKMPHTHEDRVGRGIGLADMAYSILKRRSHRASGELGLHIVEVMEAFLKSSEKGRSISLRSTCRQPKPLPSGLPLGQLS